MTRAIDRGYRWVAYAHGRPYDEAECGSLAALPRDATPVDRLIAMPADPDAQPLHVLHVPHRATPVCFWRTVMQATTQAVIGEDAAGEFTLRETGRATTLVLGWERDGERTLLWCDDDGTTTLTLGDFEEERAWRW